ncbi:MAG: cytochrome c-type biogenesis CcmF C-terminal domain-containing protein, partial [SAR324 cluster bacterium]|nr:cytochrome c-type biogenesis CcmF C-terminal domain-containing protein [SAR324 cluster bacterium]
MESVLCRENAFLAQNVLFVSIAFTVLLGTTFPLLAEAVRGTKLSIQAPFFNTVTAPMGYALLFLMAVGTLIPWRKTSMESLKKNFAWPFLLAFPLTALIAFWLRDELWSWDGYIIFWLAFFVCATMANELIRLVRLRSSQSEDS